MEVILIVLFIGVSMYLAIYGFLHYNTNLFNTIKWSPYKNYLERLKKAYEKEHSPLPCKK
jgi:hypothetical protein